MQVREPWWVLLSCFGISSFAGLAQLLRSGQELTARSIMAAFLYSGIAGLIVGLMWYSFFDGNDNIFFLISVSGLAGIGGASVIDFLHSFVTGSLGVRIIIDKGDDSDAAK